jgi:predicted acylesterase/phospholipase RssA
VGSSAGACVAGAAIFLETIEELEAMIGLRKHRGPIVDFRRLARKPTGTWPFWRTSGFSNASGMEKFFLETFLCQDFTKITPEVFVVATQLNSHRKVVFGPRDSGADQDYDPHLAYYNDVPMSQAIAASMSVPGIFQPYPIINRRSGESIEYIDGEVRETLSSHIARDAGVDLAIVSNTWVPYEYQREVGTISKRGVFSVLFQALTQVMEQKIVSFRTQNERTQMLLDFLQLKGENLNLTPEQTHELVTGATRILQYHPVEEIQIQPSTSDTKFNWISPWTFRKHELQFAVDTGYRRAFAAISRWKLERERREESKPAGERD